MVYAWVFLSYVGLCLSDIVGRSHRNDPETNSIPDPLSLTFLGTRSVVCKLAEQAIGRDYESDADAVPPGQNQNNQMFVMISQKIYFSPDHNFAAVTSSPILN